MKLRLVNKSRYRDDDLRRFLRAGFAAAGIRGDEKHVEVVHNRRGTRTWGWATLGQRGPGWSWVVEGNRMQLRVPPPERLDLADFALTVIHEALHWRGARHGDMTPEQYSCSGPLPEWAAGLVLREKAPASPTRPESAAARGARLVAAREAKARRLLERAQADARRAEARVKKWSAKVRYYERIAAKRPEGCSR